ncbi:MAG: hypothetical protein KDA52_01400 [Planctomycetaceae bacterium]|nr:hypothetical protein [Planctomycetaceae bacterium]
METTQALTTGEIARQLDAPVHRVEYVIRSRNIQPIERAGCLRIFALADLEYIADELRRMDEDR